MSGIIHYPRSDPAAFQWTTGARLLNLGEHISFDFVQPADRPPCTLTIYARYLAKADGDKEFSGHGAFSWVEKQLGEAAPLSFSSGRCHIDYRPKEPGSCLAKWEVDGEALYRYFGAITDDYVVLRFSCETAGITTPGRHK